MEEKGKYLVKLRNGLEVHGFSSRKTAEAFARVQVISTGCVVDLYKDRGKPSFEHLAQWYYSPAQGGRAYKC